MGELHPDPVGDRVPVLHGSGEREERYEDEEAPVCLAPAGEPAGHAGSVGGPADVVGSDPDVRQVSISGGKTAFFGHSTRNSV